MALRVLAGAFLFCALSESIAAPTSPGDAGTVVQTWLSSEKPKLHAPLGSHIHHVVTENDEDGKPLYHVVYLTDGNSSVKGFVIVGGDNEEEPILAISSGTEFGANPNDPLQALLKRHATGVVRQLHARGPRPHKVQASANVAKGRWGRYLSPKPVADGAVLNTGGGGSGGTTITSGTSRTTTQTPILNIPLGGVLPLLTTHWGQSTTFNNTACYNYYTPPFAEGDTKNYGCGCAATAIGQIMKYWSYPTTVIGTGSFPIQISGTSTTAALMGGDGFGSPYQWATMYPGVARTPAGIIISSGSSILITTESLKATGRLLHDVALTAQTNFGSSNSYGYLDLAVAGLVNTFHYSNAVDVFAADSISTEDLVKIITPSLDAGCPVSFAFEENGGHAVVCDGYGYMTGILYHHLDFGWDGLGDVWYALPTANTSGGNFSTVDEIAFNIFPTDTGEIISGRVSDYDGTGLSGASITAIVAGSGTYTAVSGSNGIYAFRGIPASTKFTISAQLTNYSFKDQTVTTGSSATGAWGPGYVNQGSFGSVSGVNFADSQYTASLAVTASPDEGGTVTGGGTFAANSSHQISGTANPGWAFTGWSDSVTTNPRWVTVSPGGVSYTATFTQLPEVAQLRGPTGGSTLPFSIATFAWTPGIGVSEYALWIGTTPGANDLYSKLEGTALTDTVNTPVNGSIFYVTLSSMIAGQWEQAQSVAYTAWTAPASVKARITSPANDATLWANVTFSWVAGKNATQYLLRVGSTPLGYDIFSKVEGKNLKAAVKLPMDGRRLYVTIYSMINGQWLPNSYTYTAGTTAGLPIAALTSPAEGSTFGSPQVTFRWSSCTRATSYALSIGTAPGKSDIYVKGLGKVFTGKVTLPSDGSPVYVSVMSLINKQWQYSRTYTFKSYTNPSPTGAVKAVLTSPTNGTTLTGTGTTFTWNQGKGATQYQLLIGNAPGQSDLYSKIEGTALTDTVTLPTDGRPLYVTLQSYINGQWVSNNYIYNAYTAAGWAPAEITSPADNTAFKGMQVVFNWTACTRATQYELCVGSYPGASDLYAKMEGTALTDTLTMPVDGSPVYVILLSYIDGKWEPSESYIYRAFGP